MRSSDPSEFLTIRAAAREFRISPARIRFAIRAGELSGYRHGKRWIRVWVPDLIAFMRRNRVSPSSGANQDHARRRVAEIMEEGR